ncbi:MAG: trypsin-like peptidase domain-containing protein [Microcoleaceae cyanobacterium]
MKHIIKLTIILTTFTLVSCDKIPSLNKQSSQPEQPTFIARQSGTPLNPFALNRLAKQTVVEIVSESVLTGGNKYIPKGSGVIIGRRGSTYYVLTANHISDIDDGLSVFIRSEKPGEAGEVLPLKFIRRYPREDLAVVAFASSTDYEVAEVGEASQLDDDRQVYVAGWPGNDNRQGFQFTPAKVTNPRVGNNFTYQPTQPGEDVYKGMSGGAVLNEAGQLVGIHVGLTRVGRDGEGVLISTFLRGMPPEVSRVLVSQTPAVPTRKTTRTTDNTRIPETTPYLSKVILQQEGTLSDGDLTLPSDKSIYDEHTFEGTSGQVVSVTLNSPDFDTYLAVFSPTGELLGEHDDVSQKNTNSQLTITLTVTGTYRVIVNSYDKTGRGKYNVRVIQVE